MGGIRGLYWKSRYGFTNTPVAQLALESLRAQYSNSGFELAFEGLGSIYIVSRNKMPKGVCKQCSAFIDGFWARHNLLLDPPQVKQDLTCV